MSLVGWADDDKGLGSAGVAGVAEVGPPSRAVLDANWGRCAHGGVLMAVINRVLAVPATSAWARRHAALSG